MRSPLVLVAACALACHAHAGVVSNFQVDVNSMTASAGGAFGGTSHTGAISLSRNANTFVSGVFLDGNPLSFTGALQNITGRIDLAAGTVTGGFFDIVLTDGSGFHGTVDPLTGSVSPQAGQGFQIDGLAFNVHFSNLVGGTHFGGVDVSAFGSSSWPGSFLVFSYGPNAQGVDNVTHGEFYAFVPAPGAAALFTLAGLAASRRRR